MIPRLVLVSGWPWSGKTSLRKYLKEFGFEGVSHDDIILELWGLTFSELEKIPDYREKFREARKIAHERQLHHLSEGHDVTREETFHLYDQRKRGLDTADMSAEKYIILLRVDEEEIMRRVIAQGKQPYSFDYWRQSTQWPEPGHSADLGCEVLVYQNNTPEETLAMYADVRRRFERSKLTTSK